MIGHSDTQFAVTGNSRLSDAANNGGFTLASTDTFYDDNTIFDLSITDPKNKDG
jgi:hypothetical protein